MACAGSVVLEADEPDSESEYAREGTIAHALAAHCLETEDDAKEWLMFQYAGKDEIISMEMRQAVQEYLDNVREQAKGQHLLVEQKLDLEPITGEKGAMGTADTVIIGDGGEYIQVVDLKYRWGS